VTKERKPSAQKDKDWIFVSDAHLTGKDPKEMESLVRFFNSEKERMGCLVILGDLFEFFFGFRQGTSSTEKPVGFAEYLPVLASLQSLHQHGIRIKYFEGNHDFFLSDLFREQFSMEVEVFPEGTEEELGGKKAFISHGDLSNPKERTYRIFRRILKNRLTYGLMHLAGPGLSRRVAAKLSEMSYQKYHDPASAPSGAFKFFAHEKFLEGYEIVILGHSHFPEEVREQVGPRRCLYVNAGAWRDQRSFLRFRPPDHFELSRFMEEKAENPREPGGPVAN
jgi:UDP-2,3-diacylglucosamine hydrolase